MAENQITIGEETFKLARPFMVLATQIQIEQEALIICLKHKWTASCLK